MSKFTLDPRIKPGKKITVLMRSDGEDVSEYKAVYVSGSVLESPVTVKHHDTEESIEVFDMFDFGIDEFNEFYVVKTI